MSEVMGKEPVVESGPEKLDIVDGHAVMAPSDYQNPDR